MEANKEFDGYRVLVVEDDEITREVTASLVEDFGAKCEAVCNGAEMIERLNAPDGDSFDLVLTDINMPRKNGIEACAEFRASSHPKAKSLPLTPVCTSSTKVSDALAVSKLGPSIRLWLVAQRYRATL